MSELIEQAKKLSLLDAEDEAKRKDVTDFLNLLAPEVKERVEQLRKVHDEVKEVDKQFEKEKIALLKKYEALRAPLYEKRSGIVVPSSGAMESEGETPTNPIDSDGIPEFWLTAMKHSSLLSDQITPKDESVLRFVRDVRSELMDDGKSFKLTFDFMPNPYFTNTSLTKSYIMADEEDPILEKAEGTDIEWNQGKDPTVKIMKKKAKKGKQKILTKTVPCDSFFNFFKPPNIDKLEEMDEEVQEELERLMESDYEIGAFFHNKLVPSAILWYTGEADDDDDWFGGEEDFEFDDDLDIDDVDDEAELLNAQHRNSRGGNRRGPAAVHGGAKDGKQGDGEDAPECKQQ
eukprot:Rmarinus@m.2350